jgi:hypothetical protein
MLHGFQGNLVLKTSPTPTFVQSFQRPPNLLGVILDSSDTGSKGLTSPEYLKPTEQPKGLLAWLTGMLRFPPQPSECAVCIPDGAQIRLHGISPALQQAHGLSATEVVAFRQLSANFGTYRDAVEFENGVIRLQDLDDGQSVEVLALSGERAGVQEGRFIAAPV